MKFEDLSPGDEFNVQTFENLRGDDMRLLAALLEDPYPPHFDERRAQELGYPGLLNQGPANCSYLVQTVTQKLESPSDLQSFDIRFHDMVFAGETVTASATVEETHTEDSTRIVDLAMSLEKEDGTVAVDGTATVRLQLD